MSKIGTEVTKFIKENFPVVKKRSALWFFTNEIRNVNHQSAETKKAAKGIGRRRILLLWKNMNPESKRKYFNMAEFDQIRYKEQRSLWVSEVGSLLMKYKGSLDLVSREAPTETELQDHFLKSIEKIQSRYESMIQAESTKTLYKDAIKRVDMFDTNIDKEESMISAVPKQHQPILTQPRRPPPAFVLFATDNIGRFKQMRKEAGVKDTCLRLASKEWSQMDQATRVVYEEKYLKLRDEYNQAMAEYKSKIELDNSGQLLDQASKEKKAFRKSMRKRLRDASVLPVSIRNAFNFFLKDNKDVKLSDLTQVWRSLPPDQKSKYIKMNQEDVIRYQTEIEAYREITRGLSELLSKDKGGLSESGADEPETGEKQIESS